MEQEKKLTIILGASANPSRYSFLALNRLLQHGHKVLPIGLRETEVAGVKIVNQPPQVNEVDTITLYLNPMRQKQYYSYILGVNPRRIIFNPGTENMELQKLAKAQGIQSIEGCTLVMLATGEY
ncbi:MAG: CoA-binding protein [Chitinophagales bacterium]|nr:CoA-binding protein [Chitinophagales bacterium]